MRKDFYTRPGSTTSRLSAFTGLVLVLIACQHLRTAKTSSPDRLEQIEHVVIIVLENHSFYNLFAEFPGADNQPPADYKGQRDESGRLYETLPPVLGLDRKTKDSRFPEKLPNQTFSINNYLKVSDRTSDPAHDFFFHPLQINDGKMDHFVQYSRVGALTMGYYDMRGTNLWRLAQEYTLADRFFQSAFGGSFINHQWLIAARTPTFPNAPDSLKAEFNADGSIKKSGPLTPDGYAVNTVDPLLPPFHPKKTDPKLRMPPLEHPTIGDRLTEAKVTWAWYAGGWNEILAGKNSRDFQYHHQPFLYFKNFGPGTPGRRDHLKDEEDLFAAIKDRQLPKVSFYKPVGVENAHPNYSDPKSGDEKVGEIVNALQGSPYWAKTLVIITFDEHGGFWDPIAPPKIDRWGPGNRIPAIFVSPLVRRHYVDHTTYETTSILAFLEKRFGLGALTERDKASNPLSGLQDWR